MVELGGLLCRIARFFLVQNAKTGKNIPNKHKICIPNVHKIYQHVPFQEPSKFTQIGMVG
jgi:hypothetical protein